MERITRAEVEHVAQLARLSLSQDEIGHYTRQLNDILSYVAKLEQLETGSTEPATHALELTNAFREDRIQPSPPVAEALANAPEHEDGAFLVPRII